jgi:hypothetical protein
VPESFKEKIRSVNIAMAKRRRPKVTTDIHDYGTVAVTEHWHERQDVTVKPKTARASLRLNEKED